MRKFSLLLVLGILFIASRVYAESPLLRVVTEEIRSATSDTLAMPGAVTVYTKSFSLKDAVLLGVMYRTTATGSVSYTAQLEQSFWPPTTEGSADDAYKVTDSLDGLVTSQLWIVATVDSLSALPYGRFKITSATNPVDAVLEMTIGKQ